MKVDYHLHLEEGPYDLDWLYKTSNQLYSYNSSERGSKESIMTHVERMLSQIKTGAYREDYFDLYLKEAIQKEIKYVGMVDHLYRFFESKEYFEKYMIVDDSYIGKIQEKWLRNVMTENMEDFVSFVRSQKEKWAEHGIALHVGIEADYFEGGEQELLSLLNLQEWDFVIGSVHYQDGWGFDNPKMSHLFEEIDLLECYKKHFQTVKRMIESQLFDFVSHLDNIKVFGYRPDEKELLPIYEEIADVLIENDIATEINTGLEYRYPIKEACPSMPFLQILVEKGVQITLSSDAHYPKDIGTNVEKSIQKLKQLGRNEITIFHSRKKETVLI